MSLALIPLFLLNASGPLILAGLLILLYRKTIGRDSYAKDFISGLLFLQGTRELFKAFKFRKR